MRLIDADALIEDIKSFWDWDSIDGITATTVLKQTMTDISHEPTIDAVPVVRCKDCKHCNTDWAMGKWYGSCKEWNTHSVMADWYCVNGERKDDD